MLGMLGVRILFLFFVAACRAHPRVVLRHVNGLRRRNVVCAREKAIESGKVNDDTQTTMMATAPRREMASYSG
jgi:hypothetical protein